nr:hypothetical protein [Halomonas lionensis]
MTIAITQAYKRKYPKGTPLSLATIWRTLKAASWGLMTPVIILGGYLLGDFHAVGSGRGGGKLRAAGVAVCVSGFNPASGV